MVHSRGSSRSCPQAVKKTSRIRLINGTVTMMQVCGAVRHTSRCTLLPASGCGGTPTAVGGAGGGGGCVADPQWP
eukprot:3960609-Alexandrium_andersonii.AAC.1